MAKLCTGCDEMKDLVEYSRNHSKRDGHETRCKACRRSYNQTYYAAHGAERGRERKAYYREYKKAHRRETAEAERSRRAADPQRCRESEKRYRERNQEQIRQRAAERLLRHPARVRAKSAVDAAKKNGTLTPSSECERCGHDFSAYPRHAHHPDYTKPLDVEWLCALCHNRHHHGKYVDAPSLVPVGGMSGMFPRDLP